MKRNSFLDMLKGICMIFVIITHYGWSNMQRLCLVFPLWIDMAVPIYMIVSGYVNAMSFEKRVLIGERPLSIKIIVKNALCYTIPFCLFIF